MDFDEGFNFRATEAFVTDEADEQHAAVADQYPTTANGVTFGWDTASSGNFSDANRDSGVDRRLAGINFIVNSDAATPIFRVDLPSTGDYEIHAAFGDTGGPQVQSVEFLDNATQIAIYDSVSTPRDEYMDATGVVRTEADWPGNEVALAHTFASTILKVRVGDPTDTDGTSTTICHLRIVQVDTEIPTASEMHAVSWMEAAPSLEDPPEPGEGTRRNKPSTSIGVGIT